MDATEEQVIVLPKFHILDSLADCVRVGWAISNWTGRDVFCCMTVARGDIVDHITSGRMVQQEDGTEEKHRIIDTNDPAELRNLALWILSSVWPTHTFV